MTTVGYGDIYPVTVPGKILSTIIALLGIGLVAVPTGIITAGFSEVIDGEEQDGEKKYCPYCGHKIELKEGCHMARQRKEQHLRI